MSERRFTMRLENGKAVLDPRYMAGSTADIVEHLAKLEEERDLIKKETAREILEPLYKAARSNTFNEIELTSDDIKELAKKYGAEVEELK